MSTSIARIGILSPVTEAGMKDWWNKLKEGLRSAVTSKVATSNSFGGSPMEGLSVFPLLRPTLRRLVSIL